MIARLLTLLCFLVFSVSADEFLYLASGNTIEVKKVNPENGKLQNVQKVEYSGLSKFTFSVDKKFLYAQASVKDKRRQPAIATYSIAADGKLNFVHVAPINGGTTELKTDRSGKFLAAANYGAGTVTVWALEDGIYKGKMVKELKLEKKVHAARFSPDNKVLCIPATGPNKVYELSFN